MFVADQFDWTAIADRYGIVGLFFALFVIAMFKRWIVMGYQLRDAERREQDWKSMALRGTLIAERQSGRESWTVEQRLKYLETLTDVPQTPAPPSRRRDD